MPEDLFDGIDPPAGAQDGKPQADDPSTSADSGVPGDSPPGDGTGDSSTPTADKRPATSFEAVMALAQKGEKPDGEGAEQEGDSPAPEGKDAEAEGGEPGAKAQSQEDPEKKYEPIKNARRPSEIRINELLGERKQLLPKAQTFDQLQEWTQSHGLTPEQFMRGMEVMALTRSDPKKALEALEPIITQLRQEAGIVDKLPEDLQAKVDQGLINEESAREVAELRLRNASTERRLAQTREETEQKREQQRVQSIRDAFAEFDRSQAASDPDWNEKRSDVQIVLKSIWLDEGLPATPQAAHEQAKKAVKAVNERLKKIIPPRPQVDQKLNGASNPRNVVARPKSSLDALNAALAGQRIQY